MGRLLRDELRYELLIRRCPSRETVVEMRSELRKALRLGTEIDEIL